MTKEVEQEVFEIEVPGRANKYGTIFDYKPIQYTVDENGCWICTSHSKCGNGGYFQIWIGGIKNSLHRYIFERFKEPIPKGMLVCHSCDNPSCINPEHLWLGTQKDNIQDMVKKGRKAKVENLFTIDPPKGEKNPMAKLTEKQVLQIKKLLSDGILKQKEIAEIYGVESSRISSINKNKSWKHLST